MLKERGPKTTTNRSLESFRRQTEGIKSSIAAAYGTAKPVLTDPSLEACLRKGNREVLLTVHQLVGLLLAS